MGTLSGYTYAEKLLDSVMVCDIIEFNRWTYSHYGFYIGDGICVHLTSPDDTTFSSSSSNSTSKAMKNGGKCAQLLIDIANGGSCRVNNKISFTSGRDFPVRNVDDAIQLATNNLPGHPNGQLILGESVVENYHLISNKNCEGWATYWRFELYIGFSKIFSVNFDSVQNG